MGGIINVVLKEMIWVGIDRINLVQDKDKWLAVLNRVANL
jgi:hypothetical protein